MVARESTDAADQRLRLRLVKLRKKGWRFALDASTSAQARTGELLPEQLDQLVAGVLGLDGAQVMDDVAALARWTDPGRPLTGLLAEAGTRYAEGLVRDIAGVDPASAFAAAQARVGRLIDAWQDLPNRITSRLWSLIGQRVDLADLTTWLKRLADADTGSLRALLAEKLGLTDFFATPEGQWLADALDGHLLAPLADSQAADDLKATARKTLALVDGSTVQADLARLQARVSERLGLDRIEQVVDDASYARMDAWLRAKLQAFLDRRLDLRGVEAVRSTIHRLLDKSSGFYEKTLAALHREIEASFALTYQRTTTHTALLDVTFDLAQPDTAALLARAVDGDFRSLLVDPVPGVTLGLGSLSHQISRQRTIEVHLPWGAASVQQLNDSLAKLSVVDRDGRVLLYDLEASDTVSAVRRRSQIESRLTIGAHLQVPANGVRVRDPSGFTYRYTFSQASTDLHRATLQIATQPWIDAYFPRHFSATGDGRAPGSYATWLSDLDRAVGERAADRPRVGAARATDALGKTLLSLRLSLPSSAGAAWLRAPDGRARAVYAALSRRLQTTLRQALAAVYFQRDDRLRGDVPGSAMLVWAALPPSSAARLVADGTRLRLNLASAPYWDWADPRLRTAMARSHQTAVRLTRLLTVLSERLRATPGCDHRCAELAPTPAVVDRLVAQALGSGDRLLQSLLFVEAGIVRGARRAGVDLHRFVTRSPDQPAKAIAALARFGSVLTATFNSRLRSVFVDDAFLRPLGTELFLAAASTFDAAQTPRRPAALLDITVVRDGIAPFPPTGHPDQAPLAADAILTAQRLVAGGEDDDAGGANQDATAPRRR